jgi:hypothetical protein
MLNPSCPSCQASSDQRNSPAVEPRAPAQSTTKLSNRHDEYRARFAAIARGAGAGYTPGMKTAISIADSVYAEAERLARRTKKSRSQLYTEAVAEYLARHDPEAITEAMNRVCEQLDTRPDPAISAAARRVLRRTEW